MNAGLWLCWIYSSWSSTEVQASNGWNRARHEARPTSCQDANLAQGGESPYIYESHVCLLIHMCRRTYTCPLHPLSFYFCALHLHLTLQICHSKFDPKCISVSPLFCLHEAIAQHECHRKVEGVIRSPSLQCLKHSLSHFGTSVLIQETFRVRASFQKSQPWNQILYWLFNVCLGEKARRGQDHRGSEGSGVAGGRGGGSQALEGGVGQHPHRRQPLLQGPLCRQPQNGEPSRHALHDPHGEDRSGDFSARPLAFLQGIPSRFLTFSNFTCDAPKVGWGNLGRLGVCIVVLTLSKHVDIVWLSTTSHSQIFGGQWPLICLDHSCALRKIPSFLPFY